MTVVWKKPASRAKWQEVSNTVEELGTLAKETKGLWIKICNESVKRETEVLVTADELKASGKTDENTTAIVMLGLRRLRKITEKEEAAKELLDEVQDRKQQKRYGRN